MRLYINALTEDPSDYNYSEKEEWVQTVIKDTQETELASGPAKQDIHFVVHKSQEFVFMKGDFKVNLGMLCSRCTKELAFPIKGSFENLFTREKQMQNADTHHGIAYSEPTGATGEEMEIHIIDKDYIELYDILKEQIYLKLPLQPLCKEDCKGLCAVCGQDKNINPCQCHRIKDTAFSRALKNFKIR